MSPAKFSVNQAVLTNLLFVVLLVAGAIVYRLLPVDVYPDVSLDEAWIQTPYPGASPEDVEQHVTKKIEEELEDINGVSRITSNSIANLSSINIKFDEDISKLDYEAAFQEVRTRLDRVTDLPDEVEEPILTRLTLGEVWPILQVAVIADNDSDERVIREVALELKDRLQDLDGIAKVKKMGLRKREIHLLVDKHALERYALSLPEVAEILARSNINIPGGPVQTADEEFMLRAVGDAETPDKLGSICIKKSPVGAHVYLRDIASIQEDFERQSIITRILEKRASFLYIAKKRDADSITIRNRVEEALEEFRGGKIPPGVSVRLCFDTTQMIESRLSVLKKNLGVGLVLVFVILWMFIGVRNSLLAIVGIPFSFLCAFIFMYFIGVSINAVSVFALVLVSGMIVDDAIVVLENIYRYLQKGRPLKEAIIEGTEQVMWPVISSALTTMAAFLPLLVMTGVVGRFFSIIPKTVAVALLASLLECLIILPTHYLHWGPRPIRDHGPRREKRTNRLHSLLAGIGERALALYQRVLKQTLAHRYLCLGVILSLCLCAYQAQRTLAVELFPSDFPSLISSFNIAPESSLEQTDQTLKRMMPVFEELVDDGLIVVCNSLAGIQWNKDNQMRQRSNIAQITFELPQRHRKSYDPDLVMQEIRRRMVEYIRTHPQENIQNYDIWPVQDGPPVGKPVAIRIEHPDYDVAGEIARQIVDRMYQIGGVFDIRHNLEIGQRELRMILKEEAASEFGLTFKDVFSTLSGANEGFIIGTFNDSIYDEDLDIRLKYSQEFRSRVDDLLDVDVKTPAGALIRLRQVADLQYEQTYGNHYRYNGKRAVMVTADVDDNKIDGERVTQIILGEFLPHMQRDEQLHIVPTGQFEETHKSFASMKSAAIIAVCVMYLILATQFRSYLQPLIILTTLAFGTVGMVMGLVVNQYPFSVVTGIALIGLFGIVVNDAIVLVTFINQSRQEHDSLWDALIQASMVRARPIVLTTVTTVGGLLPMALGLGGYSKIWSPFATCICWGLTSATFLILLLLPPIYLIIEDAKAWVLGLARARQQRLGSAGANA